MSTLLQILGELFAFAGVIFLGTALALIGARFYREQRAAPIILGLACLVVAHVLHSAGWPRWVF